MGNTDYFALVVGPKGGDGKAVSRILEGDQEIKAQGTTFVNVPYGGLMWALFKIWVTTTPMFWKSTYYGIIVVLSKGRLRREHDKISWFERKVFASPNKAIPRLLVLSGCNSAEDEGWYVREKDAFKPYGLGDMETVVPACTTDISTLPPLGISVYGNRIQESRGRIVSNVKGVFKEFRFRHIIYALFTTSVRSSKPKWFFGLYCVILTCALVSSGVGVGYVIKWCSVYRNATNLQNASNHIQM